MEEENLNLIQKRIRSPRSAALAGILFSGLLVTSMVLISGITKVSLALRLVPFAGIAFFWFTGVIRDHIGDREDRFFTTVFLGSGIAFVVLLFVWAAITGAIFGSFYLVSDLLTDEGIFIFGFF